MGVDISYLKTDHFVHTGSIISYDNEWIIEVGDGKETSEAVLHDDCFHEENEERASWSSEIDEMHEEPTRDSWIDVNERKIVLHYLSSAIQKKGGHGFTIGEIGAGPGYMIGELKSRYPDNTYVSTDIIEDGLLRSYRRNPDIMHIHCDFTKPPFKDESFDIVYGLNVLEHITDDLRTLEECYRVTKAGGYCLFVVPRGEKLYDYFDEILFHRRRYAHNELRRKCENCGFKTVSDLHFAWLIYPAFWIKKKWNRFVGRKLTQKEKMERTGADISAGASSTFAMMLMALEMKLFKHIHPQFGVREFILVRK